MDIHIKMDQNYYTTSSVVFPADDINCMPFFVHTEVGPFITTVWYLTQRFCTINGNVFWNFSKVV